jgi:hypothetical protein
MGGVQPFLEPATHEVDRPCLCVEFDALHGAQVHACIRATQAVQPSRGSAQL